ncbi:MAG TPA: hypothetical protein VFA07_12410 [Chthonomonadaceae bacterium]|nr:hypothetical protein [Chthonomonadaceae bacterium]
MRLRRVWSLWLPLAISFELMMLEGPAVQAAIGRLPQASLHLAAWGLTMSLALLVESPVIMLLATTIALVKDECSYRALRRFMLTVAAGCTLVSGLVSFTPLFHGVAVVWMKQPPEIAAAARPALQIMLFWVAAIAWRRFYQGILIRYGFTRRVSWGTLIRLTTAICTAVLLTRWGGMPGVQVGACTLMAAVLIEALATTGFSWSVVRRELHARIDVIEPPLTQPAILRFHAPLAATTLMTLLASPLTAAALARLAAPEATLAAAPVVFMLLLVMRGWGMALQEITVAVAQDPASRPTLRTFTWIVGSVTSGATAFIAFTPLLDLYLGRVIHLSQGLRPYAHVGIALGILLPLITALSAQARGLLMAGRATKAIYHGMGVNLLTHVVVLCLGVGLGLPGMWVAAGAFTLAALAEYVYLTRCLEPLLAIATSTSAVVVESSACVPVEP